MKKYKFTLVTARRVDSASIRFDSWRRFFENQGIPCNYVFADYKDEVGIIHIYSGESKHPDMIISGYNKEFEYVVSALYAQELN